MQTKTIPPFAGSTSIDQPQSEREALHLSSFKLLQSHRRLNNTCQTAPFTGHVRAAHLHLYKRIVKYFISAIIRGVTGGIVLSREGEEPVSAEAVQDGLPLLTLYAMMLAVCTWLPAAQKGRGSLAYIESQETLLVYKAGCLPLARPLLYLNTLGRVLHTQLRARILWVSLRCGIGSLHFPGNNSCIASRETSDTGKHASTTKWLSGEARFLSS